MEPVTKRVLGLDVAGVLRVVAEHVTQLRYHPGEHARE
jgi:hypothetical protein